MTWSATIWRATLRVTSWVVVVAGVALVVFLDAFGSVAQAQKAGLDGTWSGGGRVVFPSGETEQVRCRATFKRQSGGTVGMTATCATASVRLDQVGKVQQVAANVYAGEFQNAEYGISGSIRITVQDSRMVASLAAGGGSARLTLSR